ncbi:uncharacterized [Tachysurus ichikawai]
MKVVMVRPHVQDKCQLAPLDTSLEVAAFSEEDSIQHQKGHGTTSIITALANRAMPRARRTQPGSSLFTHGSHKSPPATATTISTSWGFR